MIDTHCHLDFAAFDDDREEVLQACLKSGISNIIVPSVAASTIERTVSICAQYAKLKLALGLHPAFIDEHQPQDLISLDSLILQHKPIAVGEIGLDFYQTSTNDTDHIKPDKEKQIAFFTKQLIIAKRHHLPVIIHNRKAHDEGIKLLAEHKLKGGIIHAFNGSIQQAEKYIELGFLLGFGGMLTYARSNKLKKLAKLIPLSSIVLETDAPDMVVEQHRGERNSPEYLPYVQQSLAQIKKISAQEIAHATSENVKRMFSF